MEVFFSVFWNDFPAVFSGEDQMEVDFGKGLRHDCGVVCGLIEWVRLRGFGHTPLGLWLALQAYPALAGWAKLFHPSGAGELLWNTEFQLRS